MARTTTDPGIVRDRRLRCAPILAWLAVWAAACVPRGEPPGGRQIIADRTCTLVGIVRPNGDGTTRLLITRPARDGTTPYHLDLFVVSVDAGDTPPVETSLAANIPGNFAVSCRLGTRECFPTDARGRLFVTTEQDDMRGLSKLSRLDPATGDRLEIGAPSYDFLSPSGERLVVQTAEVPSDATLYEIDDRAIPLGRTMGVAFLGEVVYYLTPDQDLMRLPPGGDAERLATGIVRFSRTNAQGNRLLAVTRATADPLVDVSSVIDVVTRGESPWPSGSLLADLSPSGRWFYTVDFEGGRFSFIERTTGNRDVFEFPPLQLGGYDWRPGQDEVWIQSGSPFVEPTIDEATIWIKRPGAAAVEIAGMPYLYADELRQISPFTRDGAYWFSRAPGTNKPSVQVGSADDPTGERFEVAPAGTNSSEYWRLADGRILALASIRNADRNDLYVVDPATGESTVFGNAGQVLAVGQSRILASLHINDNRGDLTSIESSTGRATVLAPEFALAAFVQRQDADRVAAGAQVAYQFQARFESPFDGIWLTAVP